ncbi:MAG: hypothetical protein B6U88_00630 [Candidatus Aenigmarchaeota archaeon ex4484_56]|nr:MAG: hypothetical protein B6U88_00630 [Candidatus Aenigmarchaeota archaeon ex4484_56]
MDTLLLFIIFVLSTLVLYKSSEWVLKYSLTLSKLIGISTLVFGFIVVSISTSLPELFIAIFSYTYHEIGLSIGNVLGSNFANLSIVLGVSILFGGTIYLNKKDERELIELLFLSTLITLLIFQEKTLSVVYGLILLCFFGFSIAKFYRGGKVGKEFYEKGDLRKVVILFILSMTILLISSHFVVDSALQIASLFNLTSSFIGMTIVALGTSLPELSVQIRSIKYKEYGLAMGNIIGSCLTNITLILGVTSILAPVKISVNSLLELIPFLFISIFVVWYSISYKRRLTGFEGMVLVMLYILFILEVFSII